MSKNKIKNVYCLKQSSNLTKILQTWTKGI